MKSFRIVVALRLSIFPLIFNLSIAQELEVNINESSFWTSNNEVCPSQLDENPENITQMDSSSQAPQNDNNIVPLYERGYPDFIGEGIFNDDEEVKILSPQQAEQALDLPRLAGQVSFQKGVQ